MTIAEGGRMVRCDAPGCPALEALPPTLACSHEEEQARWIIGRAWTTEDGRTLCPEHW
jgi:hypothetical protein